MNLNDLCTEYLENASLGEPIDEDLQHLIFEAAMEQCLGEDVWGKIQKGRDRYHAMIASGEPENLSTGLYPMADSPEMLVSITDAIHAAGWKSEWEEV